jgi:hypothetical protein
LPFAWNEIGVKSALARSVAASCTRPPRSVKSKSAVSLRRRRRPAHLVAFVADRLLDVVQPQGAAFDRRRRRLTESQERSRAPRATGRCAWRAFWHSWWTGHRAYDWPVPYPVSIDVQPARTNRNRLTVAFRIILAIPHLLLVGGIGMGFALQTAGDRTAPSSSFGSETGLLGAVAYILAIVTWFAIVIGGRDIPAIRQYTVFYLRWRVRALAYLMLLQDAYPPFGDDAYPASLTFVEPEGPRRRLSVGFPSDPDHPAADCRRVADHRVVGHVVRGVAGDSVHRPLP